MGFQSNGQTSLNNNRSLREKNRWKFEGAEYPMPESYINIEEGIDKDRIKSAETKRTVRIMMENIIMMGVVIVILLFVFLKFNLM